MKYRYVYYCKINNFYFCAILILFSVCKLEVAWFFFSLKNGRIPLSSGIAADLHLMVGRFAALLTASLLGANGEAASITNKSASLSVSLFDCLFDWLIVWLFVCLFPNSSETANPSELKFWGNDSTWDWEGFRLKNIRIRRTVSRKIKKN